MVGFVICMKKKLVVLDLNGVLVRRELDRGKQEGTLLNNFRVWKRPHCDEFLAYLFEHFRVAIWSSVRAHNVAAVVGWLMTPEQRKQLVFEWDQEQCVAVPHPNPAWRDKKPLFMKPVENIDDEDDVVICDDDPLKVTDTSKFCQVKTWDGNENDTHLLELIDKLNLAFLYCSERAFVGILQKKIGDILKRQIDTIIRRNTIMTQIVRVLNQLFILVVNGNLNILFAGIKIK